MGREIINLYVGQFGNQVSRPVINQILRDAGFNENGQFMTEPKYNPGREFTFENYGEQHLFERDCQNACSVVGTRGIHIDSEGSVLDSLMATSLKRVVDNAHVQTDIRDASLCFASGRSLAKTIFAKRVEDRIRTEVEKCDQLMGFFPFHSTGGGTGSGFFTVLYDYLIDSFDKSHFIDFQLSPSLLYSAPTEPINACLLAAHKIKTDHSHGLSMLFDNQSLYRLMYDNLGVENPTFANVNEMIATLFSNMSFYCDNNLHAFEANICPFKHINHLTCAVLPLKHRRKSRAPQDIWNLLVDSFAVNHEMCNVDLSTGKYLCTNLFFRGKGNHPEIYGALNQINKFAEFVSYVPTGFSNFSELFHITEKQETTNFNTSRNPTKFSIQKYET